MNTPAREPRQPNILFIMADQFRADALGTVNGWTRSASLDRLAAEGVLFEQVFDTSAECVPARFSLATGLYPHQTQVWRNDVHTLNPECPNWMQAIERAGYHTTVVGKTHLHPHEGDIRDRVGLMKAYGLQVVEETTGPHAAMHVRSNMTDWWEAHGLWEAFRDDLQDRIATRRHVVRPSPLGVDFHYDVYVGQRACAMLRDLETAGRPWFFWVSFAGPHEPWDAPEPYASMYAPASMPPALKRIEGADRGLLDLAFHSPHYSPPLDEGEIAAMRANYAGNVTLIDDQIGKILAILEERGELDETLIVFTSDHGEMNGDHHLLYKANFLDPVIRLPLIVRPPKSSPGERGRREPAIVELLDVGATITDYAGGRPVPQANGRTLRPFVEGREASGRTWAVSEFDHHSALITANWKIEFDPGELPCLLLDRGDPDERRNALGDRAYEFDVRVLSSMMRSFRAATPPPAVKVSL